MQPHGNMIPNLNLAISGSKSILPNANTVINLAMLQNTVLSYTPGRLQLTVLLLLRVQISIGSLTLLHRITSPLKYPICTYTLNMMAQMKCSLEMVQVWKSLTQVLLLFLFLNALSKFKTLLVFPPLIKIWFQSIILPNTTMCFLNFILLVFLSRINGRERFFFKNRVRMVFILYLIPVPPLPLQWFMNTRL